MNELVTKGIFERIIKELNSASKSIKIAVAWINFDLFESVFIAKSNKVNIEMIINDDAINNNYLSTITKLRNKGIKISFMKMPTEKNYMHEKMAIIDDKKLIVGSYNWSKNASKNFENVIITDDCFVVNQALQEYKEIEMFLSLMDTMCKQEKDANGNLLENVILERYDVSHGGTEEYDIWLITLNNQHEVTKKKLICTYSSSMIDDKVFDEDKDELFDFCLELVRTSSFSHSIDVIVQLDASIEYTFEEYATRYKAVWKNRFTNAYDEYIEFSEDDFA